MTRTAGLSRRTALALGVAGLAAGPLSACGGRDAQAAATAENGVDNVMGNPDAPVTMIEYASITCPHCKRFHDDVFPTLKTRYIDTGKVRFIFRELPTAPGPVAIAGFLTARCAGPDKYFDVLDALFDQQEPLIRAYQAGGTGARDDLRAIAADAGVSEERFDACIRDQAEIERIHQLDDDGAREFGVSVTPTFVINAVRYEGEQPVERFIEIIDPLLSSDG